MTTTTPVPLAALTAELAELRDHIQADPEREAALVRIIAARCSGEVRPS